MCPPRASEAGVSRVCPPRASEAGVSRVCPPRAVACSLCQRVRWGLLGRLRPPLPPLGNFPASWSGWARTDRPSKKPTSSASHAISSTKIASAQPKSLRVNTAVSRPAAVARPPPRLCLLRERFITRLYDSTMRPSGVVFATRSSMRSSPRTSSRPCLGKVEERSRKGRGKVEPSSRPCRLRGCSTVRACTMRDIGQSLPGPVCREPTPLSAGSPRLRKGSARTISDVGEAASKDETAGRGRARAGAAGAAGFGGRGGFRRAPQRRRARHTLEEARVACRRVVRLARVDHRRRAQRVEPCLAAVRGRVQERSRKGPGKVQGRSKGRSLGRVQERSRKGKV